jgi:hypothetical protein
MSKQTKKRKKLSKPVNTQAQEWDNDSWATQRG